MDIISWWCTYNWEVYKWTNIMHSELKSYVSRWQVWIIFMRRLGLCDLGIIMCCWQVLDTISLAKSPQPSNINRRLPSQVHLKGMPTLSPTHSRLHFILSQPIFCSKCSKKLYYLWIFEVISDYRCNKVLNGHLPAVLDNERLLIMQIRSIL